MHRKAVKREPAASPGLIDVVELCLEGRQVAGHVMLETAPLAAPAGGGSAAAEGARFVALPDQAAARHCEPDPGGVSWCYWNGCRLIQADFTVHHPPGLEARTSHRDDRRAVLVRVRAIGHNLCERDAVEAVHVARATVDGP